MTEEAQNTVAEQTFATNSDGLPVPVEQVSNEVVTPEEPAQEVAETQEPQPENIEQETPTEEPDKNIEQPETVQLNKDEYNKLKEYELIEAERQALQNRLGLQDVDPQNFNYQTLDQQVINSGQQELLRLCNEYGVSADPSKFEESVNKLKETNTQKGFELERKVEVLMSNVGNRRQQIAQQASHSQVQRFAQENQQLLNASPVLNKILTEYVQVNAGNPNIYNNLNTINSYLLDVYREGLEYGQRIASLEKLKLIPLKFKVES